MSTEIRNFAGDRSVCVEPVGHRGQTGVGITIRQNDRFVSDAHLPRADFLAAVASELDVIVIPRADLPATKSLPRGYVEVQGMELRDFPPNVDHYRMALAYLAVVEHHKAAEAVDEAEVEALAAAICEYEDETTPAILLARRLVAAGWTRG